MPMMKLWHGGVAGLSVGDYLVPSPPHVNDGCPICLARDAGRVCTVGEFRDWLIRSNSPKAAKVLTMLGSAPDYEPIDPPSGRDAVYITTDRDYAAWHAARSGNGDLYEVEPIGDMTPSEEDQFPTWTVAKARVIAVARRSVRLSQRERRRLLARWE